MSGTEQDYTAMKHARNVRSSNMLLLRLKAAAAGFDVEEVVARHAALQTPRAAAAVKALAAPPPPPPPPVRKPAPLSPTVIRDIVCDHFGVTRADIESNRRHAAICRKRQMVWYLTKEYTSFSFPQMVKRLGRTDHTTALHGYSRIKNLIAAGDPFVCEHIDQLRDKVEKAEAAFQKSVADYVSVHVNGSNVSSQAIELA